MADWNPHTQLTVSGHRETERAIKGVGAAMHGMGASSLRASAGLKALSAALNVATFGMKAVAAGAGLAAGAIAGIGVASVRTLGQMQKLQLQLNTLYGSQTGGKKAMDWLRAYDKKSPLSIMDMAPLASSLKSAGFSPSKDLPTILDAVMAYGGGAEEAASVIRAMGQSIGAGRMNQEELNQLTEALPGFPAIKLIRDKYGVAKGKDIAAAGIDPRNAWNAILNSMDERFGGASDLASKTIPGLLSTLESSWQQMQIVIGQTLAPAVLKLVDKLTALLADPTVQRSIAQLYGMFTAFIDKTSLLSPESLKKALRFDWLFRFVDKGIGLWFQMEKRLGWLQVDAQDMSKRLQKGFYEFRSGLYRIGADIVASVDGVQSAILELVGKFSDLPGMGNGDEYRSRAAKIRAGSLGSDLYAKSAADAAKAAGLDPDTMLGRAFAAAEKALIGMGTNYSYRKGGRAVSDIYNQGRAFAAAGMGDVQVPTGALGRPGGRQDGVSGPGRGMSLMDRIVLWGGGDRARSTRAGMDLGLSYLRRSTSPTITVQMRPASSKPMDVAVAAVAQETSQDVISELLRSPAGVQWMRSELGLA